jgi:hypothetical protein
LSNRRQKVNVSGEYSDWQNVLSGVPQGSVLGPLLFLIFINDIDEDVMLVFKKFADDTKLYREITCSQDSDILQEDLEKLVSWSEKWKMSFNIKKCSVMHVGRKNESRVYSMGACDIENSTLERDLGLFVDSNIKFSHHCSLAAKNANRILGQIRRNIEYKSKEVILRLYKALVRPHLEYCIQVWNPYLKKDIEILEKVQRRATKMIPELKRLCYEDRLNELGLISLKKRRVRGDLIQVYKMIKGIDKVKSAKFFTFNVNSRTRGHRFKFEKKRSRLELRKNFFSQRIIDVWNKLPVNVVEACSVNAFKNELDRYDRYA